jgi:hypothetical protein
LLGERGDTPALMDAIAAYRAALEVYTPVYNSVYAKEVSDDLAEADAALAKRVH